MTKIEWTSEMILELKRLQALEENLTFKVIAERMSTTFNLPFTRNSMVGKSHRLKLPPRDRNVVNGPRKPYIKPPKNLRPDTFRARYRREINFLELRRGQCKWPAGEGPYTFCGKPIVGEGAPYCAKHSSLAYVKPKKVFA